MGTGIRLLEFVLVFKSKWLDIAGVDTSLRTGLYCHGLWLFIPRHPFQSAGRNIIGTRRTVVLQRKFNVRLNRDYATFKGKLSGKGVGVGFITWVIMKQ